MAEDLTDYLGNVVCVYVICIHSDINTIEQIKIIRDLRLSKFHVLVGMNLLCEELNPPKASLVAQF